MSLVFALLHFGRDRHGTLEKFGTVLAAHDKRSDQSACRSRQRVIHQSVFAGNFQLDVDRRRAPGGTVIVWTSDSGSVVKEPS